MKEIEKKWLIKQCFIDLMYITAGAKKHNIEDFYFNEFTRLRHKDKDWYLTIKSEGTLVRDEFEIKLDKSQIDFLPSPMLKKIRYVLPYKEHNFEVNIFKNVGFELAILELELKDENEQYEIPDVFNNELIDVTDNKNFYGWGLFNIMKSNIKDGYRFRKS